MSFMTSICLLAVAALWLPSIAADLEADVSADALVYAAILEHTLRPQAQKLLGASETGGLPPVVVCDSTVAACGSHPQRECITESTFERLKKLLEGNDALVEQFRIANAERHSIAGLQVEGAIIVPAERSRRVQGDEFESTRGHAVFGRPLYTRDGHAIVYAAYHCGSLCGYGWLFLLLPDSEGWQVVAVELLWIS